MTRKYVLECDDNFLGDMAPLKGSGHETEAELDWTEAMKSSLALGELSISE